MKFGKFILLTLVLVIFAGVFAKNDRKRNLKKSHANKKVVRAKNDTAAAGNSTNGTDEGPRILNSVGRKVYVGNTSDIILTAFPFEITRCDQVASFKAQFIPDIKDYRTRSDAFFTLSAHYANMFVDGNNTRLVNSILLSESNILPRIMEGSGGCVFIFSPQGSEKDISICLEDPTQQQNILSVLKTFSECRGGIAVADENNPNRIDPIKVTDMIKTCGGKGKFINPLELMKRLNEEKQKSLVIKKNPHWFHPGFDGIPGTEGVKQKEDPKIIYEERRRR